MFRILFLLFIIVPIIEISLLIQVGSFLGFWPTMAIVIVTAWFGAKYVKQQGMATLRSVQEKTAMGQVPSDDIISGVLLLVAGVVLVTPGFVTDIIGLALLVPVVRKSLILKLQKHFVASANTHVHFHTTSQHFYQESDVPEQGKAHQGKTLDGEYERKD
ncbi:FxsA family protein [Thalassotalea ganghwensis]